MGTGKNFQLCLLLLLGMCAQAQLPQQAFDNIRTVAQAEKLAANPKLGVRIVRLSDDRDTAASFRDFFVLKRGAISTKDGFRYRMLEKEEFDGMRCSYILLDGGELSFKQIDELRKQVLGAYKKGTPFTELVQQYSMDGPNGDTDWFPEGKMVKDFEDAVRDHKAGDIFLVDVPEKRWYYVVLKTYADRRIRRITMVMAAPAAQ